jgi:hypothetical protein
MFLDKIDKQLHKWFVVVGIKEVVGTLSRTMGNEDAMAF